MNIDILASLPFKILHFIKSGVWIRGVFYRSFITQDDDNKIYTSGTTMSSKIVCKGKYNEIAVNNDFLHSEIRIEGDNNTLKIADGGVIGYSSILIRANNAHVYIGKNTEVMSMYLICQGEKNYIEIGDDCLFSRDVEIWNTDSHAIYNRNGEIINPSRPIIIEDHVWLGKHVTILKGVTIHENSVVGMNSVVTKSIAPNSIAVGNPAKIVSIDINWSKVIHQEASLMVK